MIPLTTIRTPPPGKGRPPIGGTVLAAPDGSRYVAVRCAYSCGLDTAGTGSPRAEVWVALAEDGPDRFAPILVRGASRGGAPLEWAAFEGWGEIDGIRREQVIDALRLATHDRSAAGPVVGPGPDDWPPTTILDRRVILPDDPRWPKGRDALRAGVRALIARRNECPDEEVGAIDCMIMNLCPRAD